MRKEKRSSIPSDEAKYEGVRRILRTADNHHAVARAEIRGLPPGVKRKPDWTFPSI